MAFCIISDLKLCHSFSEPLAIERVFHILCVTTDLFDRKRKRIVEMDVDKILFLVTNGM